MGAALVVVAVRDDGRLMSEEAHLSPASSTKNGRATNCHNDRYCHNWPSSGDVERPNRAAPALMAKDAGSISPTGPEILRGHHNDTWEWESDQQPNDYYIITADLLSPNMVVDEGRCFYLWWGTV